MAYTSKSNTKGARRNRGFSRASALVSKQVRNIGEERGFAETRLLTHWPEIVGPDIAALCRPLRVSYGRGGLGATLTLLARGAAGPQIQSQLPQMRDLVNACYGYNAISQIKLTQTAPTGYGDAQTPFSDQKIKPEKPDVSPAVAKSAESATEVIQDPALRAALSGLGEKVLFRQKTEDPQ